MYLNAGSNVHIVSFPSSFIFSLVEAPETSLGPPPLKPNLHRVPTLFPPVPSLTTPCIHLLMLFTFLPIFILYLWHCTVPLQPNYYQFSPACNTVHVCGPQEDELPEGTIKGGSSQIHNWKSF